MEQVSFSISKVVVTMTAIVLFSSFSAAALTVTKGNSVEIPGANSTIEWGRNYTFDINTTSVYNRTLELGDHNISIYSNTSAPVNSTLWRYNLSNTGYGNTLVKVETSAVPGSAVYFEFTGLPSPGNNGEFRLKRGGNLLKRVRSAGTVSWQASDWSTHNFTITHRKQPTDDGSNSAGGSGSSGSIDVGGIDLSTGLPSDTHSWTGVNRRRFIFDDIDTGIGLTEILVVTRQNRFSFDIVVARANASHVPELAANAVTYYQLNTSTSESRIKSATLTFTVNRTVAQRYDDIVLSRYTDGWKTIPTAPINLTGEKRWYRAQTSGDGYFAIHGKNNETTTANPTENQTSSPKPACGNGQCEQGENWTSCSADCQKPAEVTSAEQRIAEAQQQVGPDSPGYRLLMQARQQFQAGNYTRAETLASQAIRQTPPPAQNRHLPTPVLIVSGTAVLLFLLGGGFLGRRWLRRYRLEQEAEEIRRTVHRKVELNEINDSDRLRSLLDRAENALEQGDYNQLKALLDSIEKDLE